MEYWMFTLFNIIFLIVAAIIDNVVGLTFGRDIPYGFLTLLYSLAIFIPGIAVIVRRLHDQGKSGWWYFISFIPLIGGIWMLILLVTDGTKGENEYGPDPKT